MDRAEEPRLLKRIDSVKSITVYDLLHWCVQRGLDPDTIMVTAAHLKWESPETDKERALREKWHAETEARHAEWERETYERLHEKFSGNRPVLNEQG